MSDRIRQLFELLSPLDWKWSCPSETVWAYKDGKQVRLTARAPEGLRNAYFIGVKVTAKGTNLFHDRVYVDTDSDTYEYLASIIRNNRPAGCSLDVDKLEKVLL